MTKDEIIEALKSMTLLEASELVKAIEETFDVSAQAAVAMPMAGIAGAGQAEAEEEQTEFAVILKEYGAEKIKVIKEVRSITGLGLKEAKDLVEAAPTEVAKDIPKDEAEELIKKLEAVGATVEIK